MFFTYVLFSPSFNKIYIGQTSELFERLKVHAGLGVHKSWACRYAPWHVVYLKAYKTGTSAVKKERQLKSARGRKFIWNDIIKGWSPPAGG